MVIYRLFFFLMYTNIRQSPPLHVCQGSQGTAQTVRWPGQEIILLIEHFEGPTEVQLNSGERLVASDQEVVREWRLNLYKTK